MSSGKTMVRIHPKTRPNNLGKKTSCYSTSPSGVWQGLARSPTPLSLSQKWVLRIFTLKWFWDTRKCSPRWDDLIVGRPITDGALVTSHAPVKGGTCRRVKSMLARVAHTADRWKMILIITSKIKCHLVRSSHVICSIMHLTLFFSSWLYISNDMKIGSLWHKILYHALNHMPKRLFWDRDKFWRHKILFGSW